MASSRLYRNHKKRSSNRWQKSIQVWLFHSPSMPDGIEDLLQRIQDAGISITNNEIQCACLAQKKNLELSDEDRWLNFCQG